MQDFRFGEEQYLVIKEHEMIEAKNLVKRYGSLTALNLPELKIPEGDSFGLVGNNGAGKTTFFSLILDLIRPAGGAVYSKGETVFQSEHWKRYTGAYLDERMLIDFLKPEEYFEFLADLYALTPARYADFLATFEDFFNGEILGKKKYIRDLSKGNQKKIGVAAAMIGQPEVLVLDEPFPHLDPSSVIRLKNILREIKAKHNVTMLISSHDLNHVTEVCDRIVLLERGNIMYDLQTNEDTLKTLQAYFGA